MAQTRLQIWSGAFAALVGGRLRSSEVDPDGNPTDRNAQPIAAVYDSIVQDALTIEAWPWSIARVALSTRVAADGQPERYRFTMPAALPGGSPNAQQTRLSVGPRALYDAEESMHPTVMPWRVSMEFIYSDAERLWGVFQFATTETSWPTQFAEYVRLRVCAETAGVYTGDPANAAMYQSRADAKLAEVIDAVQQVEPPHTLFDRFQTTDARYGGLGYRPIIFNADGQAAG